MSWKRLATTVSAAVLAGWAATASADEEFGRSGPYIGAGAVYAFETFSGNVDDGSQDGSWGYHLTAGYRFNEYFALEAFGEQFVEYEAASGEIGIWGVGLNGKFYPFSGRVQPYLAVGSAWSGVDDDRPAQDRDSTGIAFRFSGGLDVYLSRNWALFADVGYFLGTSGRADYGTVPLSFGVLYRFL